MKAYLVHCNHIRGMGSWTDKYLVFAESEEEAMKKVRENDYAPEEHIEIKELNQSEVHYLGEE